MGRDTATCTKLICRSELRFYSTANVTVNISCCSNKITNFDRIKYAIKITDRKDKWDQSIDNTIEPVDSIRYKLACAHSEYSNEPVHSHSLTRVLVFRLNKQ